LVRKEEWSDSRIELAHPTVDSEKGSSTWGEHFNSEPTPPIRNTVLEAICNRKSIRLFKPNTIPDDVLWTVLEAGRWAPSGEDVQTWYMVVIKDSERRKRIYELSLLDQRRRRVESRIRREATQFSDRFTHLSEKRRKLLIEARERPASGRRRGRFDARAWEAPVHVIVVGQRFNSGSMSCDVNLAMENMLIAAVSLGLGCVILGAPRHIPGTSARDPIRQVYELLKIPIDDYRIVAWVCMGYPDQVPRHRPRFFIQDKVFFEKWGHWAEMPRPMYRRHCLVFPEYVSR
jgi:nitroreductase